MGCKPYLETNKSKSLSSILFGCESTRVPVRVQYSKLQELYVAEFRKG